MVVVNEESYIDRERRHTISDEVADTRSDESATQEVKDETEGKQGKWSIIRKKDRKKDEGMVDIVLSDMCEPWLQTAGFWKRSLSDPYTRMMNTSGISFRDHAGSMVCVDCQWCRILRRHETDKN